MFVTIFEKTFWHFFKVMPCEMILKKKWDAYRKIKSLYYGHVYELGCIRGNNTSVENNKTIWFFWNTGISSAPAIVRTCYKSLLKNVPEGWNVITLSEESTKEYVQLPAFVEELKSKGKMWYALYADLIRLALLYRYGGIWCDATCYLTQLIPQYILDSSLFMFSYEGLLNASPAKFENWFIKADRGNYVIERILQDLLYYWSQPHKEQEYFVWFHLQSALYNYDEKARKQMDEIPYVYNYEAMLVHMHYGLDYPYTDRIWQQIQSKCFVQKLTYKYDKSIESASGKNLLQHILKCAL